MLVQLSNVVAGFTLAAPKIKEFIAKDNVEKAEQKLVKFRGALGVIALVLGVLSLLGQVSYHFMFFSSLMYAGPLQAIVSIAIGLILSASLFSKSPQMSGFIAQLGKYGEWIGIVGVIIGILGLI